MSVCCSLSSSKCLTFFLITCNILLPGADNSTPERSAACAAARNSIDTLDYCSSILEREVNSVTDNPILNEEEVISAGNFHGEPVALASDFLSIALPSSLVIEVQFHCV